MPHTVPTPHLVQFPCRLHGSDDVVAALDYGCRDVPDALHVVKEIAVAREPPSVDKVVARWKEIIRFFNTKGVRTVGMSGTTSQKQKLIKSLHKRVKDKKENKEEKKEGQTSPLHAVKYYKAHHSILAKARAHLLSSSLRVACAGSVTSFMVCTSQPLHARAQRRRSSSSVPGTGGGYS